MSNWSVVMIGWSGVDKKVIDHEDRFRAVVTRYAEISLRPDPEREPKRWRPHYPCDDPRAIANACEFLAVTHKNWFDPEDMLKALGEFEWQYPEDVVVLSKSEQQYRYEQRQLKETDNHV